MNELIPLQPNALRWCYPVVLDLTQHLLEKYQELIQAGTYTLGHNYSDFQNLAWKFGLD